MKLMLALDINEDTSTALVNEAILWAQRTNAVLDLVYAMPGAWGLGAADAAVRRQLELEAYRLANEDGAVLKQLQALIPEAYRGSVQVLDGNPLEAISSAAAGYDALLVGTHGRTGVAHFFLGSMSEQLLRRAPCPVLVLRLASS